ncbi:NADH-cytochrome b5 reductase-like isoform X3 [Ambystoma mexicanum]|uniref:NADH-cytochrome b5 reductase-like isoform X3 n=1 Tax=Ambystoma mexicanum TaxID=8296 RepID=UPI0037E97132
MPDSCIHYILPQHVGQQDVVYSSEMDESSDDWLSLKPVQPLPSQCCGSGCTPCIFDIYQKELALWEEAKKRNDKNYLTNKETNKKDSNAAIIDSEMFTAFKLCSVERLTDDTCQYRFELPRGWTLGLTLGQHIVLRGTVNDMELQRAYTPISPVDMEDSFEVLIKYGQLLMLASGTGVAPMLPIMQHITGNEDDETFVTLVGCFRNFKSIYMKPLLQDLSLYWNIKTVYALSQEETIDNLPWSYQEKTHIGRIDCDVLRSVIDSCRRKPYVLICGSLTFNEDMVNYLKRLELQEDSCFIF